MFSPIARHHRRPHLLQTVMFTLALFAMLLTLVPALPVHAAADLTVYDDSLASGWQDWSWSTTRDFSATTPSYAGSNAIAVEHTAGWGALSLNTPSILNAADYSAVTFWVHGGTTGAHSLQFFIHQDSGSTNVTTQVPFTTQANTWTQVTVTMAELGNPSTIHRVNFQDRAGAAQPVYYLDDIVLVGSDGGGGGGGDGTPIAGTIQIDTTATPIDIDPRLLGANLPAWLGPSKMANTTFRERAVASGVSVLRMPGGSWSNEYGWLSCEQGSGQTNAQPCGENNTWASWVARPTDFLNFLNATGIDGMWVVNPNGTAQEAAALVAFFNAEVGDTTVIGVDRNGFNWQTAGTWAQLRSDRGNAAPLGIKLWAVGNEIYATKPGAAQTGGGKCQSYGWETFWTCDGGDYINGITGQDGFTAFRTAMQAIDPTIAVAPVGVPSNEFPTWDDELFAAAGTNMDYYDVHQYAFYDPPANYAAVLAQPQSVWAGIVNYIRTTMQTHTGVDTIPIAVTEYNLFSVGDRDSDLLMNRAVNALFIADTIGQMATHGITMANQWGLANGVSSTGSEYGLLHEGNNWYR
ncbi:MAG: hypothetical protein KDD78_09495, partial [Caldilineaceae bacterium]|nr:hypothetical protein [Caldilineaceae bacterium]